ncbi:MAG TPA: tellurium resistance protein TerC [bacterium]|nr:tellurium resistance protein TerC [bacterium]
MPDLTPAVLLIVLQLIYLEGILSIDNAAVLGAMVSHLPAHAPIPWPGPLRGLQRPIHRLLGGQRPAALKVGLLGAYLGRGLMLFIASWVIQNRWLLLLGGLYLIKLAVDHLGETPAEARAAAAEAAGQPVLRTQRSFWNVVLAVELADLAFSLDNVVAAVALSREFWVVMTGVALGIVTMRFAAGIFVRLIDRYPVVEAAAYLLVLSIGVGLLVDDFLHVHLSDVQRFAFSLGILLLTLLYGRSAAFQRIGASFLWLKRVLGFVNLLFIYALKPATWLLALLSPIVRALVLLVASRTRKDLEAGERTVRSGANPEP